MSIGDVSKPKSSKNSSSSSKSVICDLEVRVVLLGGKEESLPESDSESTFSKLWKRFVCAIAV